MPPSNSNNNSKPLIFTLLCIVALFVVLVPSVQANGVGNGLPAHRRAQQARMIRKRAPLPAPLPQGIPIPPPIIQVGEDPAAGGSPTGTETSTGTGTTGTTTGTGTTTTTTGTGTGTGTTTDTTTTTGTTTTTSTSETLTTTNTTSTTSTPTTTSTSQPTTQETLDVTSAPTTTPPPQANQAVTLTVTSSTDAPSQTTIPKTSGAASVPKTTITILIVIGASIGGAILLWTIIRKWKFRPSSQFEDRMQPIDWQPSVDHDNGVPGSLRRTPSNASHGSFHSGSDHGSQAGRGYGATSDHGHGSGAGAAPRGGGYLADLPAHDFTAGPSHVGGYADLARGPSPQPQMTENLQRGASLRGYDNTYYNGARY